MFLPQVNINTVAKLIHSVSKVNLISNFLIDEKSPLKNAASHFIKWLLTEF